MEVHQLRYFLAVCEHGSFSRAAERMRVAQPSLSQQIQKLEAVLGEPLFNRLARRVTLTAAGQALVPFARRILNDLNEARRSILQQGQEVTGVVRLGVIPTILPFIAEALLRATAAECAGIEISLIELFTDEVIHGLDSGDLDLGIVSTCRKGTALQVERCGTEALLLAVPSAHALAKRKRVRWSDLRQERLLLLHESNCLTQQIRRLCRTYGLRTNEAPKVMQMASLLSMTAAGSGLALVPEMAATPHGQCAFRRFRESAGQRELNLVWNHSRHQSRAAQQVASTIRRLLAKGSARHTAAPAEPNDPAST